MKTKAKRSLAWLHWLALIALAISCLSGFSIAQDDLTPIITLPSWLRLQGNLLFWHSIAAGQWLVVVLGYLLLMRHPQLPKRQLAAKHYWHYWQLWLLLFLLAVQLISGVALWWWLPAQWVDYLHEVTAYALLALVICHALWQLSRLPLAALLQSFSLRVLPLNHLLLALVLAAVVIVYERYQLPTLNVPQRDAVITLDGLAAEDIWQRLPVSHLTLGQGAHQQQTSEVTIRAFHDGESFYALIRWADSSHSLDHLPLLKTATGWQVQHQGFERDDELTYYEDKLALMLSNSRMSGGNSVHLGAQPLDGHPASRSQRGFHYLEDGQIADIWHFKAVRGPGTSIIDDMHFGAPAPPCQFCVRYPAGYAADPKDSGGMQYNWDFFNPTGITPRRLPNANTPLLGVKTGNESASQLGRFADASALSWYRTEDYANSNDHLAIGSQMPSVLYVDRYEGDRADVQAQAVYQHGYWQLELVRALDTGSPYDVAIADGTALFVALFDHVQSRHRYHHRPLIVELQ